MEVKGIAVKSIAEFVKKEFPEKYTEWWKALPEDARQIISNGVITNQWYNVQDAVITPTKMINKFFYNNHPQKGAWQSGKFSADYALNGIYKLYVRASTPKHIISRAGRVFSNYYKPCVMKVVSEQKNSVTVHITNFSEPSAVVEFRIGGWMERALEISGCNNVNIDISKSLVKGDDVTEYVLSWN